MQMQMQTRLLLAEHHHQIMRTRLPLSISIRWKNHFSSTVKLLPIFIRTLSFNAVCDRYVESDQIDEMRWLCQYHKLAHWRHTHTYIWMNEWKDGRTKLMSAVCTIIVHVALRCVSSISLWLLYNSRDAHNNTKLYHGIRCERKRKRKNHASKKWIKYT